MRNTSLFNNKLELSLLIVGIILSLLMFKTLMVHRDNTQLMDKVMLIKNSGAWVHHGNAATKMGSLPGSFLTAATALPMMVWFSPYAACAIILLCHLLGYFFLRRLGYKIDPNFNPLLLVIFFWLNPWRVEQSELYNPGYLFLFSGLHLWSLYQMRTQACDQMREQKSFWASFWLAICLGFCFQVHFSVLILGISFAYLFFTKKIKVNYAGLGAGLVVVAASLVPWALQLLAQKETALQPASDTFIGKNFVLVYPVIKALIYFFRMGSVYFGRHIFSEINFDWMTIAWLKLAIGYVFHALKWILALVTLILSVRFFYSHFRTYKIEFQQRSFIDHYMISLFIGVFGAASLSPVEFNHWHFVLCLPAILFYISLKPEGYFIKIWDKKKNALLAAIATVFIIWNIFASFGSRSHSFENNYDLDFKKYYNLTSAE